MDTSPLVDNTWTGGCSFSEEAIVFVFSKVFEDTGSGDEQSICLDFLDMVA